MKLRGLFFYFLPLVLFFFAEISLAQNTIQPGTKMPQWFPDGMSSFRDFPDEDKERMAKAYGLDGQTQMDLLLDFMNTAGRRGYTAVQPKDGDEQASAQE